MIFSSCTVSGPWHRQVEDRSKMIDRALVRCGKQGNRWWLYRRRVKDLAALWRLHSGRGGRTGMVVLFGEHPLVRPSGCVSDYDTLEGRESGSDLMDPYSLLEQLRQRIEEIPEHLEGSHHRRDILTRLTWHPRLQHLQGFSAIRHPNHQKKFPAQKRHSSPSSQPLQYTLYHSIFSVMTCEQTFSTRLRRVKGSASLGR
ncbi:hypothetical protein B0T20DRAFT_99565 [Sordaria brevicollis]|uniref:Uncharacterized protein n=1 Tax=Sordaria brevicollis TaxID=83679 RepID=A0AAE0NVX1_SORBR|nr:hypothetical protein B0T20DRAFT_99565 [Sordaria brevicollis]